MLKFKHVDDIDIAGVKPERSAILPAGLAILEAIFDALSIQSMSLSEGALREGVLYDLLGRYSQEDVRERSIKGLMERSHVDVDQALRVEQQALNLLAQVKTDWQLEDEWLEEMLSWAARVHEVGLDIAHYHYHKHGAYLVEHSDLAGFSRQDQQMMALLVRGHRRNIPIERFKELGEDGEQLLKLCVLLRLAILLRHIRGPVELPTPKVKVKGRNISVSFPNKWLKEHSLTAADFKKEAEWLQRIDFILTAQ